MWASIFHHNRQAVKIIPIKAGDNLCYSDGYSAHWLQCSDQLMGIQQVRIMRSRVCNKLRSKKCPSFSEKLSGLLNFTEKRGKRKHKAIWWTHPVSRLCPYVPLSSPWVPLADCYHKFLDSHNCHICVSWFKLLFVVKLLLPCIFQLHITSWHRARYQ